MRFEGYVLALNTPRRVETNTASVLLGGYRLSGVADNARNRIARGPSRPLR
jgi:hypothetical protein